MIFIGERITAKHKWNECMNRNNRCCCHKPKRNSLRWHKPLFSSSCQCQRYSFKSLLQGSAKTFVRISVHTSVEVLNVHVPISSGKSSSGACEIGMTRRIMQSFCSNKRLLFFSSFTLIPRAWQDKAMDKRCYSHHRFM